MKAVLSAAMSLALSAYAFAAEPIRSSELTPQPRARLNLTSDGFVARIEKSDKKESQVGVVVMDKVVVAESMLPAGPRRQVDEEPTRFSVLRGGPIVGGQVGALSFAAGLWPWTEVFIEDAKFRTQKTHIDLDVVKIKW
jgi:hypothetical protein